MKRTVLIVAHNEAAHIAECLESIERQTLQPDEILLVAHNCTDDTVGIAKKFPHIRIEELTTEERAPIYPRIRGFELATHEIIACIDGDGIADRDWLEKITKPLENKDIVGVGGIVWFRRDIVANIMTIGFFWLWRYLSDYHFYFWGANFACKKSAYDECDGLLPFLDIKKKLALHYMADDCYLSLALEGIGRVVYEGRAKVTVYPKSTNPFLGISRGRKQDTDRKKLFEFFKIGV